MFCRNALRLARLQRKPGVVSRRWAGIWKHWEGVSRLKAQSRLLAEDSVSKICCALFIGVSPGCSLTGACKRLPEHEHCWGSRMAI